MDRYMEQDLNLAIAEYVETGVTRLPRWKLYKAYGAKRISTNVWRDVKERIVEQGGSWMEASLIETESYVLMLNEGMQEALRSRI